jgi:hypothetical protein
VSRTKANRCPARRQFPRQCTGTVADTFINGLSHGGYAIPRCGRELPSEGDIAWRDESIRVVQRGLERTCSHWSGQQSAAVEGEKRTSHRARNQSFTNFIKSFIFGSWLCLFAPLSESRSYSIPVICSSGSRK